MIDLYTWTTPNGRKVSIALEELGLDYESHAVNINAGEQHKPEFIAISPNAKIPAIVERETGFHLMESGAILLWLAEREGKLLPTGAARWEVIEWLMWQMGGAGPFLGQAHHFLRHNRGVSEYAENRYRAEARRLYKVLDGRLEGRKFIADDYSIADIAVWPWISRYEWQEVDMSEVPNVRDWYLRIADRPAVQLGYDQPKKVNEIPRP